MLNGNEYWGGDVTAEMVLCNYKGRKVYTYAYAPQNLYTDLHHTATKYPERTAIVGDDGREMTYAQFLYEVKRFSQYLYYEQHVKKGDMVALMLRNTPEFCVAVYALSKLSAVIVPISTKYTVCEWKNLLGKLPVRLALVEKEYETAVPELKRSKEGLAVLLSDRKHGFSELLKDKVYEGDPYGNAVWEDDLILMYTSGTTGESKGVVLSNFNVANAIAVYQRILRVTCEDKTVIATPIYHITGLVALLGLFVHCGGTVYLHLTYRPERVLECARENGLTLLHASPTVFLMLLEQRERFPSIPSLRTFACGSANIPPEVIRALHDWLPDMDFRTVYGLTESSSAGTSFPDDAAQSEKIGSSGLPVPGTRMKLLDDEGREVETGEGELAIFGNVILDRYYNLDTDALGADGWFRTGDIARFDEDGYVYIVDRKKDMINRGGEKVWSSEVENLVYQIPQVAEAAVIGVPDKKYGEAVMAVIRIRDGEILVKEEVIGFLKGKLAKFKIPKYIVFTKTLPQTGNGKLNKREMRRLYGDEKWLARFEKQEG